MFYHITYECGKTRDSLVCFKIAYMVGPQYFLRSVCRPPSPWNVYMCYTTDTAYDCPPHMRDNKPVCIYRKTSSISRTKSQNLNVSCILLQLSLLNPLKPGVKLRMKM